MVEEWIEYLKQQPKDGKVHKIIDHCDRIEDMNALHVAVTRNKVKMLQNLVEAGAGLFIVNVYIYIIGYTLTWNTYSRHSSNDQFDTHLARFIYIT